MQRDILLESELRGKSYIIHVTGVITADTLEDYRKYMDILIDKMEIENKSDLNFVIDYSGVQDVDSSAIANILDRLKNDVRPDHEVVFVNVNKEFRDLVDLHKVGDKIRIFNSLDEALAAVED